MSSKSNNIKLGCEIVGNTKVRNYIHNFSFSSRGQECGMFVELEFTRRYPRRPTSWKVAEVLSYFPDHTSRVIFFYLAPFLFITAKRTTVILCGTGGTRSTRDVHFTASYSGTFALKLATTFYSQSGSYTRRLLYSSTFCFAYLVPL